MVNKVKKNNVFRQGKRQLATLDGVKLDLKKELPLMFKAFREAYELYEKEIIQTPPTARARGFEASLLNSKMIQSIQNNFPNNWRFGRYKRFSLCINGYIILFKKLNKNGKPMNIKTKSVNAINNQLSLALFDDSFRIEHPILYFGYEKDKIGNISNTKLVYLDEDKVKWTVTIDDVTIDKPIVIPSKVEKASPILRKKKGGKRKII